MDDDRVGHVRVLVELLREFDLDAIRLRVGETEYELVGREPVTFAVPAGADGVVPAAAAGADAPPAAGPATPPAKVKRVTAPVVGVFYNAPSPGADPFVQLGDRVVPGQTLCILEAMKLMNEIASEFAGAVVRVLPENGQLVSLGDDLFWIEP
jgi:acetyl-CoA carboxylase biotin carboxyl carrier protein